MNPSGLRLEEKKSTDNESASRSVTSYKSTHSSRSSVLERAREYNRRIDEQNNNRKKQRSKSMERVVGTLAPGSSTIRTVDSSVSSSSTPRSKSTGRLPQSAPPHQQQQQSRLSTHERAMQSVRRDTTPAVAAAEQQQQRITTVYSNHSSSTAPDGPPPHGSSHRTTTTTTSPTMMAQQQSRRPVTSPPMPMEQHPHDAWKPAGTTSRSTTPREITTSRSVPTTTSSTRTTTSIPPNRKDSPSRVKSRQPPQPEPHSHQQHPPDAAAADPPPPPAAAIVTPELLVDALSGHEDGLLAIAEKLMEHYDAGYDVMGEAIIDAFADVQKLFQHVVEAAHMEGAAFEASRRDAEMTALRQQAADHAVLLVDHHSSPTSPEAAAAAGPSSNRHDEFIDQDVKDVLADAIRKGTTLRDAARHFECYQLFEQACQAASSLLPVDSDHRGRLQLSIARAESMSPDRACAILRYAMDDVLRSGLRAGSASAGRTPADMSKRADVVLDRPHTGSSAAAMASGGTSSGGMLLSVQQSPDEALASLMEELKEILSAPVFLDTPLQEVAGRFWAALQEALKQQQKKEERLEQNLAQLKGEFLLARAEWEEKLTQSTELADSYKLKYENLKSKRYADTDGYMMDHARSYARGLHDSDSNDNMMFGSVKSQPSKTGSVASLGSGLAQHARSIVTTMNNNFNCSHLNERNGPIVDSELSEMPEQQQRRQAASFSSSSVASQTNPNNTNRSRSRSRGKAQSSRSFREYSRSPQRVDV